MSNSGNDGCCGGGACGGKQGMPRRDFLKSSALAAGLFPVLGSAARAEDVAEALRAWTATLWEKGQRRVYRGAGLTHIRFPLGGLGAGQILLDGHGRLRSWQMVNNFNEHAEVPGACFALHARDAAGRSHATLLEAEGRLAAPGVPDLAFSGEYPFAWLDYGDAGTGMPLSLRMEAFSPMVPLDELASGLPCAVFHLDAANTGDSALEVTLLTSVPNLAGWDGYQRLDGAEHPAFGRNRNEVRQHSSGTRLLCGPVPGRGDRMADPVALHADNESILLLLRRVAGLTAFAVQTDLLADAAKRKVFWLDQCHGDTLGADLEAALDAVAAGAGLVVSGPMFEAAARAGGDAVRSRVFEDFESGDYGRWTVEGTAFGEAPAAGTLPGQNPVTGFLGGRLVNSYSGGDDTRGHARSAPFTIDHDHIHLLVGGGNRGAEACVQLVVAGEAVLRLGGRNEEHLRPQRWDVAQWRGQDAHLEIVDAATGGWGHINVDHIVFSDSPASPYLSDEALARLRNALPLRWTGVEAAASGTLRRKSKFAGIPGTRIQPGQHLRLLGARPAEGARVLLETAERQPLVVLGRHGKGRVILVNGDPQAWTATGDRRTFLAALAALAADTEFDTDHGLPSDHPHFGTMALEASGGEVSACPEWTDWPGLWTSFSRDGRLQTIEREERGPGSTCFGALAATVHLAPGERKRVRFTLAWHFPNRMRDERYGWGPRRHQMDHRLGNHYNTRFKDAEAVLDQVASQREALDAGTRAYHQALYDSSLPHWFIDAISANTAILRSPIFVWLEDGTVGGFEGSDACCPLNCTHVYNYAMAMAYLFPALERRVRHMDLLDQMHPTGHFIPHRTVVPLSEPRLGDAIGGPHHHALDGELGTLLKLYRDWRMSGDRAELERLWPNAARVARHILRDHDVDGSGVIRGEQPNTYDTHLYGSNTFIGTLYLATLRAVEEMARLMDDGDLAEECRARFRAGRRGYDKACWNGEFYVNNFDAPGVPAETYNQGNCYGPGCHADQLLGQWWAHLLDLGHLLPEEHVEGALEAIERHNWRASLADHVHQQRVFAEGGERGLLNCAWPNGGRPDNPILYCDEVWTGIEYHVAATMLYAGMPEAALRIVRSARDRYTGEQRNPWSEIECGGFYARALSSWSLLHAAGGYAYDAASGALRVAPNLQQEGFRAFFIGGGAWGNVHSAAGKDTGFYGLDVRHGTLTLSSLSFALPKGARKPATSRTVQLTPARDYAVESGGGILTVRFPEPIVLTAGESLIVRYG